MLENFPRLSGVYQLASQKINKYELLKLINRVYGCQVEIKQKSDYLVDKSLNCELYSKLTGFKKPEWL